MKLKISDFKLSDASLLSIGLIAALALIMAFCCIALDDSNRAELMQMENRSMKLSRAAFRYRIRLQEQEIRNLKSGESR